MAEKRMFTMKICDSDAFLEMPLSTQCLYFHLNMRADDDGFIGNPKRVMQWVGASGDDLKLLIAKRFLLVFEDGVIVIKHWRMHNTLQKDRHKPTSYQDELAMLEVKKNKSYSLRTEVDGKEPVKQMETKCYQNDSVGLGLGLDSDINKTLVQKTDRDTDLFDRFYSAYPRKVSKSEAKKSFKKLHPTEELLIKILKAIEIQKQSKQWQTKEFIPHPATWLNQKRWEDETDEPQNGAKLVQIGEGCFKLE